MASIGGAVTAWSTTTLAATIIGVVPTILESRILYLFINWEYLERYDNNNTLWRFIVFHKIKIDLPEK